jgi:hypothetical protein
MLGLMTSSQNPKQAVDLLRNKRGVLNAKRSYEVCSISKVPSLQILR